MSNKFSQTVPWLLVEGNSVRSVERITDVHRDTILRLLVLAGERCERLMEDKIKGPEVDQVQCDELWGFVGCKEKRRPLDREDLGDVWGFVAIERTSKLVLCWHPGKRTLADTQIFTDSLDRATSGLFQLTTDGFGPYLPAVRRSVGHRVNFAQLIKVYRSPREGEQPYSPASVWTRSQSSGSGCRSAIRFALRTSNGTT